MARLAPMIDDLVAALDNELAELLQEAPMKSNIDREIVRQHTLSAFKSSLKWASLQPMEAATQARVEKAEAAAQARLAKGLAEPEG